MNSLKIVYVLSVAFLVSIIFASVPKERPMSLHSIPMPSTTPQEVIVNTTIKTEETQVSPSQTENVAHVVPTLPVFSFEPLESKYPNDPQRDAFFASLDSVNAHVKIGFVIMLYENTNMLFRLMRTIYRDYHEYVIVMDTKADINDWNLMKAMYTNITNIRMISRRVCYSTPSMVLVEIEAARMLLERDIDYVTSLSNRDYPVRPLSDLEKFLTLKQGWSFMNVLGIPDAHLQNTFSKFYLDAECTRAGMKQTDVLRPDIGFKMYFGSQWHTMSRELTSWILDSPLSFYVINWLSTASNTDEFFWSTMAAYSPYIEKVHTQSMTYVGWDRECDVQPCTLVMPMWEKINNTGMFWGRKFKMEVAASVELMDFLDEHVHKLYE